MKFKTLTALALFGPMQLFAQFQFESNYRPWQDAVLDTFGSSESTSVIDTNILPPEHHPIPIGEAPEGINVIERVGQGTHCDPRIAEYIAEANAYATCPSYTSSGDCNTWYSTYRTTYDCPNWTNPNQGLNGSGARHTVTVVCECIPEEVICTPSYGGVICSPK